MSALEQGETPVSGLSSKKLRRRFDLPAPIDLEKAASKLEKGEHGIRGGEIRAGPAEGGYWRLNGPGGGHAGRNVAPPARRIRQVPPEGHVIPGWAVWRAGLKLKK